MNIYEKLQKVQEELKAPKSQTNNFGKYKYRSTEDVLEALKPLLAKNKLAITITDDIEPVGDRVYVVATVAIIDIEKIEDKVLVQARAREAIEKKGMDLAQVTGATSSYARKYALNGMFAIDDTKDSDTTNEGVGETSANLSEKQVKRLYAIGYSAGLDTNAINQHVKIKFKKEVEQLTKSEYDTVCNGYEELAEKKESENK